MAEDGEIICANRECRVAETGRCVEGFELSACPHYGREADPAEPAVEEEAPADDGAGLHLPGADTLTPEVASGVLRRSDARVIAVIGPKGAGKTSLVASLYDLFQEGDVGGAEYARSDTLHAFELACHDARMASRRSEPDMERTPHGEVRFYHLDLAGGPAGGSLSFLLGDRAGEEYRAAADDAGELDPFPEIVRADTVTVLVDGQRLQDSGARHNLRSEVMMILQALQDGGVLGTGQQLLLVLTKLDAVQASPHRDRAQADFEALRAQVERVFGDSFGRVETCQVAASPKTAAVQRGLGVAEVLASWAVPSRRPDSPPTVVPRSARAFGRLTADEGELDE
jgi:energy-coupling factor transporter ATP-binding protein EcfA2